MGWYRAVKEKLSTKRDTSKTSQSQSQAISPTSPTPHSGGSAVSSTAAAHYEMKDNTIIVGLCLVLSYAG